MSSDEDQNLSVPAKKRRVQRACDKCRMKKRACDGLRMSEKKCTYCIENGLECTFSGALTKRRSYVDVLEARLELTEQLLRKSSEGAANTPSPAGTKWSSDSPILKHQSTAVAGSTSPGPGVELAALTIRSMNTPAPAPHGDDLAHIALTQDLQDLSLNHHRERFHGKSSGAMLVKAAVQLREKYEEKDIPWTSRRMRFWTFNPANNEPPLARTYTFPEPDLLSALMDFYFSNANLYYPLLHRPTFERSIADGLHLRDTAFGSVVLVVCAIGSRYSKDPRVCGPEDDPLRCGWQYFDQIPHVIGHLFVRPNLYHLQYYCLAVTFLEFSTPAPCWTFIGLGIRLAQDVGAHRAKHQGSAPTVESELWKRAFWVIVCMDRICSSALGRQCNLQYEDFDVELPIECDDEYWENDDPALAFRQPAGKPSRITFFNCFIRLNNIWAFSLKILYSLNKAKGLLAVRDDAWEEHIVAELDSALNGWVDSIPSHLRWDPNRRDDAFFDQSAYLYSAYYQVQITIHRPFIPMIRTDASTALPSLAICTNAARSCSHIADIVYHRKNGRPVPILVGATFTSAIVLLLNIWSGKRTGLPPHMNSAIAEVHKCMATIRVCEERWQSTGVFWDLLYEIAVIGQLPLPEQSSPPASVPIPAPAPAPAGSSGSTKRPREENTTQYPRGGVAVAHPSPYADIYPPSAPAPTTSAPAPKVTPAPFSDVQAALPTYTADLGRLPVFHPYADSSSWYPTQTSTAPLGYPDFAVGQTSDASYSAAQAAFLPGSEYGVGTEFGAGMMSNDAMAMWANAPKGFEADDWGSYFSVMSDLNQGMGAGGSQP